MRRSVSLMVAVVMVGAAAGPALALTPLPAGPAQVNNDPAAGIDTSKAVGLSAVTGGSLTATDALQPWATFEQAESSGQQQVFARSYANGAWTTRGAGVVNGSGGASPFAASLNFDQTQAAEAPAIDFAGTTRATPWATWYEASPSFVGNPTQVFASRFDSTQAKWVFAGQQRTASVPAEPKPPSLNIDTAKSAENPAVAGGATTAGNAPSPWVAWQEQADSISGGTQQIFVARSVKLDGGITTCPGGTKPSGGSAVGGFCWQQVGTERAGLSSAEPSLNVDRGRDAVEPAVAFAGPNDTVPWVVWYEKGTGSDGPAGNEMVFAAKAVSTSDAGVDGAFKWEAVGNGTAGKSEFLNNATDNCVANLAAEQGCSLNKNAANDAEDPRVAAGAMTAGAPDVPWIVWDEQVSGVHQVFVSHLVGDHFEIVNAGAPISTGTDGADRPDIAFSGNTPYVTWRQKLGTAYKTFSGHFVDPTSPTFVLDNPGGTAVSAEGEQIDGRSPVASTCEHLAGGTTCPGGALGTPYFLQADGALASAKLFAQAYSPDAVTTGAATGVTTDAASVNGSANPEGAAVTVQFDVGTTTAYGTRTAPVTVPAGDAPVAFAAALTGLPAATTMHYRAIATNDFGTVTGADSTFTTAAPPAPKDTTPPKLTVTGSPKLSNVVKNKHLKVAVTLSEPGKVTVSVLIGKTVVGTKTVTFTQKGKVAVTLSFTKAHLKALSKARKKNVTIRITCSDHAGNKGKTVVLHVL